MVKTFYENYFLKIDMGIMQNKIKAITNARVAIAIEYLDAI